MPSDFIDSNVLIYAALREPGAEAKRQVALDLLRTTDFAVSGQVIAESYYAILRKATPPWSDDQLDLWLTTICERPCVAVDGDLVRHGAKIARRYKISYWDGAVVAAAERIGATTLYTEDLNDGQIYGAVTVRNPFNSATP